MSLEVKIDQLTTLVAEIKQDTAVLKTRSDFYEERIEKIEKSADQYKSDRAKVIGGSITASGVFAWIIQLFHK